MILPSAVGDTDLLEESYKNLPKIGISLSQATFDQTISEEELLRSRAIQAAIEVSGGSVAKNKASTRAGEVCC